VAVEGVLPARVGCVEGGLVEGAQEVLVLGNA
jgi:hypothetical protein